MSDCSSDCDHSVRCCGDLPQLRVTLPVILVLPILQPGLRDIVRAGKGGDERLHNAEGQHNDRQERLSRQRAAPVRDVRDYCESMGEDLDDFESDVGANYKLRYEVQEIDTASERKMSTLTLLQSGCFLTD